MIALLASIPGGTTLMSRFFGKRSFTGPRLARLDERNNITPAGQAAFNSSVSEPSPDAGSASDQPGTQKS